MNHDSIEVIQFYNSCSFTFVGLDENETKKEETLISSSSR